MIPIFVFIALPSLSLALVLAILCRRLSTSGLHFRGGGNAVRRAMSRLEALQALGLEPNADPGATHSAACDDLPVAWTPSPRPPLRFVSSDTVGEDTVRLTYAPA